MRNIDKYTLYSANKRIDGMFLDVLSRNKGNIIGPGMKILQIITKNNYEFVIPQTQNTFIFFSAVPNH